MYIYIFIYIYLFIYLFTFIFMFTHSIAIRAIGLRGVEAEGFHLGMAVWGVMLQTFFDLSLC